jgi:hypothetical protein
VKVARLESLGASNSDQIDKLMMYLFTVTVLAFLVGGDLCSVLRTCAASMIMYHAQVTTDCGPWNAISVKLCNAARATGITDPRFSNVSLESILDEWSKIVKDDFHSQNVETWKASPDVVSLAHTLNQCFTLLKSISTDINELQLQQTDTVMTIASQKSSISLLQGAEAAGLKENLAATQRKLGCIRTPPDEQQRASHPIAAAAAVNLDSSGSKRSIAGMVDASGSSPSSRQRMEDSTEPDAEERAQEQDLGNTVQDEESQVPCVPRYTTEAREIAENDGDTNKNFSMFS